MFRESKIAALVELLREREVCLTHSCQLLDFGSYMKVGGIPSRNLLSARGVPFTLFETDNRDKANKVWDKTFLNLVDFGEMFAFGNCAVPTVYGPIALRVNSEVLLKARDIAICLRSAGAQRFDRDAESLKTVEEVDRLFIYPKSYGFPKAGEIMHRTDLEDQFQVDKVSFPEMSLSFGQELIPLEYVNMILVDPYTSGGVSLVEHVTQAARAIGSFHAPIKARPASHKRRGLYAEMGDLLLRESATPSLRSISSMTDISSALREWAAEASQRSYLEMQWRNYAEYTLSGTLRPMIRNA